jgi:hypothetical protein
MSCPDSQASRQGCANMFSLREVADDKFIYHCHECGWESETVTKEQAIAYMRSHGCAMKPAKPPASPTVRKSSKAS